MDYKIPEPITSVIFDDQRYNFRRDFYGRFRVYYCGKDGTERDVSRHTGYPSLKEAWDRLFEYAVDPDKGRMSATLDLARAIANSGLLRLEPFLSQAKKALEQEGLPL